MMPIVCDHTLCVVQSVAFDLCIIAPLISENVFATSKYFQVCCVPCHLCGLITLTKFLSLDLPEKKLSTVICVHVLVQAITTVFITATGELKM